jgi:hypothetical protein
VDTLRLHGDQPAGVRYQWPVVPGLDTVTNTLGVFHAPDSTDQILIHSIRISASQCGTALDSAIVTVLPAIRVRIDTTVSDSVFLLHVANAVLDSLEISGGTLVAYDTATGRITIHWNRSDTLFSIKATWANALDCSLTASLVVHPRRVVATRPYLTSTLNVWPVPARSALHLSEPLRNYGLFALTGEQVLGGAKAGETIALSVLPAGTYVLKGETAKGFVRLLVVKE